MTDEQPDSNPVDDEPREVPTEPPNSPDSDLFLDIEEADHGPPVHG
jgi:hypothetical protein